MVEYVGIKNKEFERIERGGILKLSNGKGVVKTIMLDKIPFINLKLALCVKNRTLSFVVGLKYDYN